MNREIGSEFWNTPVLNTKTRVLPKNTAYFLSGRTALDYIIQDIKAYRNITTVYMPSYCCHTMIEPFKRHNLKMEFYDIIIDDRGNLQCNVDYKKDCDVFYVTNYFGFANSATDNEIKYFHDKGAIVIKDATHSVFNEDYHNQQIDYYYGSLRKWTQLYSGGFVLKNKGAYLQKLPDKVNKAFVDNRKKAVNKKKEYFNGSLLDKNEYLTLFSDAEDILDKDYINYAMDDDSLDVLKKIDINNLVQRRRNNAKLLMDRLMNSNFVTPIFRKLDKNNVPLFIPVLVKKDYRDKLKQFLIMNDIYCPVHWPLSTYHDTISKQVISIYLEELSLICDQRYSEDDMNRIATTIFEFKVNAE